MRPYGRQELPAAIVLRDPSNAEVREKSNETGFKQFGLPTRRMVSRKCWTGRKLISLAVFLQRRLS